MPACPPTLRWTALLLAGLPALAQAEGAAPASVEMGRELYLLSGATTCTACHGADAAGGSARNAADLRHPRRWKTYQALGGNDAAKRDPASFQNALHDAVTTLLRSGAFAFNRSYHAPAFDWTETFPLDIQMLGLTGPEYRAWLGRKQDQGVSLETAADALFLYLQTLDRDRLFAAKKP